MNTHFSIGLYDNEGDKYEEGIFIHVSDSTILRFKDLRELEGFSESLPSTIREIKENLVDV